MPHQRADPSIGHFIHRRVGHTLVAFEERLYLWGGYMVCIISQVLKILKLKTL